MILVVPTIVLVYNFRYSLNIPVHWDQSIMSIYIYTQYIHIYIHRIHRASLKTPAYNLWKIARVSSIVIYWRFQSFIVTTRNYQPLGFPKSKKTSHQKRLILPDCDVKARSEAGILWKSPSCFAHEVSHPAAPLMGCVGKVHENPTFRALTFSQILNVYIYTLHKYIYYISLYILYTWYIMIPKSTTASKNKSTSTPNNCKQVPGSTNKQIIPKLDEHFHQNTLVAPSVCSDAVPPSTDSSNQRPDHQVEYSHQPGRRHPLKGSQSKASEKQQRLIPMNKNWWTVMKHGNVFV